MTASSAVPGTTTADSRASTAVVSTNGRCPHCERFPWEPKCQQCPVGS